MTALIIIGYLIGFFTTVKLLKKKFKSIGNDDKIFVVFAGLVFPLTLFVTAIIYIGRLMTKFYDWL